jgi:UDP-N-acetylmuramoyl-tripeptide--D-alanyl-D-alanine ligase
MKKLLSWPFLLFLRRQARRALAKNRPLVVGVAGAVGKSSTVQAIYAAILGSRKIRFTPGNSETGVPLGILNIKQSGYSLGSWIAVFFKALFPQPRLNEIEVLIVEMGTDELTTPKNMEYLLSIVQPDISVWLNVYAAHLSLFGKTLSRAEQTLPEQAKADLLIKKIAHEDGKIITASGCKTAIYCTDNQPIIDELAQHQATLSTKSLLTFGQDGKNTLSYTKQSTTLSGTTFEFLLEGKPLTIALPGYVLLPEYREVLAAALLTARECGVEPIEAAKNIMNNFSLPPGRSSIFWGINGSTILDSSYNSSPEAATSFLKLLTNLRSTSEQPTVFLCGDMRELGEHAEREHKALANQLPGKIDYLYCVGTLTKQFIVGYLDNLGKTNAFKELRWFPTSRALGEYLKTHLPERSLVLAKGSQNTIYLEEAVAQILRDPKDKQELCRQEEYWLKMKQAFLSVN